jgi:hypothetical protein
MFDIFKNLFNNKQPKANISEVVGNQNQVSNSNFVTFELDADNKPHVLLDLDNLSTESAKQLGILFYLLNEGYYIQPVLDVLLAISKQDVEKNLFTQTVLNSWNSHINTNSTKSEEPLIKPTQFNPKG